jgi:Ca2+-binding RTX toxin-like protein/glucose/arabinose dehydrogenase
MSGSVFLAQTQLQMREWEGSTVVEIRLSAPTDHPVTVTYGIATDNATPGLDFAAASGTITIAAGATSAFVPIAILDDQIGEATEVFSLDLIKVEGAGLAAPRTLRISILDDETPAPPPAPEPLPLPQYETRMAPVVPGGLFQPLRFAFSPLDPTKIYIAEKDGVVKLADTAAGTVETVINFTDATNSLGDRGLLGLAVHPDLAQHPYLYLFYVVDPMETGWATDADAGRDGAGNRFAQLVRLTLDAATGYATLVPGSEVVLLGGAGQQLADISGAGTLDFTDPALYAEAASDRIAGPTDATWVNGIKQDYLKVDSLSHGGGALVFGRDGALYVGTGDGTSYNYADPRSADVQSLDALSGKILRIDPLTGEGLADNPFVTEGLDLDSNRAKVFQLGLRNPFSFAEAPDGRLVIGDVGWWSYEEINAGGAGANFGWPWFEGGDGLMVPTPVYRNTAAAQAFYQAIAEGLVHPSLPLRGFAHEETVPGYQMQAVVGGGVVYTGDRYPDEFRNDFFFSDFVTGRIFSIDIDHPDQLRVVAQVDGRPGPIQMIQGPDGWIWYADIVTGQIGRLEIAPLLPAQTFVASGDAAIAGDGGWRLTPAAIDQAGAIGATTRIDFRANAHLVFDLNFGDRDAAGAEGIALVLHNDGNGALALGRGGDGLGAAGINRALVLRIDTWQTTPDAPRNDHLRIVAPEGVATPALADLGNVEDGLWHRLELGWDAQTQRLTVRFDGGAPMTLDADLAAAVFDGSFAHVALTAATGGFGLEHQARLVAADVLYEDVAAAQAPVVFGGAAREVAVAENSGGIFLLPVATDAEGDVLHWRIAGGADAARFTMDSLSGALAFRAAPDFEVARDANRDNRYQLVIEARDAGGLTTQQALTVRVTDIAVEPIRGTAAGETLTGRNVADHITGLGGNDLLRGGGGNDTFAASLADGADTMIGGAGSGDLYTLEDTDADAVVMLGSGQASSADIGQDVLRGIEDVTGGGGDDSIIGNSLSNVLRGLGGADTLTAGDGDDELDGGSGDDRLDGGWGADLMAGGTGNDQFRVDDEDDEVVELARGGTDQVTATIDYALPDQVEHLLLAGTAVTGRGNALANRITGNAQANLLEGGEGADTLVGGQGADTLRGGLGADRLEGNGVADVFVWGSAAEGGDRVIAYRGAEDSIAVSAAGFGAGLVAGMNLVASGHYEANALGLATLVASGVFVFDTTRAVLRWDADGAGARASVVIADFSGATGWSGAEILVIA